MKVDQKMSNIKEIWLVRHCESMSNAGYATVDTNSIPLTEKGWKQAALLSESFNIPPDLIVTSPYLRTHQTSTYVKNKFSQVPQEEWNVQEFTYLCGKKYINTTTLQRQSSVKEYWERCDPFFSDGEGAESFLDLINRVSLTVEKIKSRKEKYFVIFTHGQFIKALWWSLTNFANDDKYLQMLNVKKFFDQTDIKNGDILKIKLSDNNWSFQLKGLHEDNLC